MDSQGTQLPKTNWRIHFVDSEETACDGPAANAIDGDPSTIWHTEWCFASPAHPHEIQIDTGALQTFAGFTYLPRAGGSNGRIGDYRFFVSLDGVGWTEVAQGTFADDSTLKTVPFVSPPVARYLRTIPGPIGAGESVSVTIRMQAGPAQANGVYTNTAEIVSAFDGTGSRLRDVDSTPGGDPGNDIVRDEVIDNSNGDEDDHNIAAIGVGVVIEPPTIYSVQVPMVSR